MKISYEDYNFSAASLDTIDTANEILDAYSAKGYTMTLRQLYYQFVSRDLVANTERSYKNLGNLVTKARDAGLISWTAIEDGGRGVTSYGFQEDPREAISDLPYMIAFDQWARQDYYIEVWVEKHALNQVISRPARRWRVPYMSCKGYLSASEAWRSGQRFQEKVDEGKEVVILHLGDHDPSGIDMTRDNRERSWKYAMGSDNIEIVRLALNMDQIEEHRPPPNPAKITDSRAQDYIRRFGNKSWELDALDPTVIDKLIDGEIQKRLDIDVWDEVAAQEREAKDQLRGVYDRWDDVVNFLRDETE